MGKPVRIVNLQRIQQIRDEVGGDDAEALARLFEDEEIISDESIQGRLEAILAATEHRWVVSIRTFLDIPLLQDCKGFSDQGFRAEFRDPWACSRDQVGHILTAVGLALYPEKLEEKRWFGIPIRDLVGAPKDMSNEEVAIRLIIGHEKRPDPGSLDPLVLPKVRKQFASATDEDVAAFLSAQAALGTGLKISLYGAKEGLAKIQIGEGRGNSIQDLNLSLVGCYLAQLIKEGQLSSRQEVATWVRTNLKAG